MKLILKIPHNSFFKRFLILMFLLLLFIIICATSYVNTTFENISENIFRLHVVANSNSAPDQQLKFLVRDAIAEYINEISLNLDTKSEIVALINENIAQIEELSKKTISDNGYDFDITVETGSFSFPTKHYGDISLPARNI